MPGEERLALTLQHFLPSGNHPSPFLFLVCLRLLSLTESALALSGQDSAAEPGFSWHRLRPQFVPVWRILPITQQLKGTNDATQTAIVLS